jgi:HAD superfamily hydrolase (TIGR01509 family)
MDRNRAVLWNLDGTLIDSEDLHWMSWRNTLALEGIFINHNQFLSLFGQSNESILMNWMDSPATPDRVKKIAKFKEELYQRRVRRYGIAPLPAAVALLRRLHVEGWQQAVVSSASRADIDAALRVLACADLFQVVVGAEDLRTGKPAPEGFCSAASKLRISPDHCIVVDSYQAGIEAAQRAGMKSIAVGRDARLASDLTLTSLELLDAGDLDSLLRPNCVFAPSEYQLST